MRCLLLAALSAAVSGQTLLLEAPERVRVGEAVEFRVTREGQPAARAEVRVLAPASAAVRVNERAPLHARPDERSASVISVYPGETVPLVSASGSWCEVIDAAGGRGFVLCDKLERQSWGSPLGRTGADGVLMSDRLALVPMAVIVQAVLGSEASAPRTVEVEFAEESARETVAPGIELTTRRWVNGTSGPFAMQVLEADPNTPAVNILPVRAGDRAAARETTSSMAARYGAAAAVNGGYFTPGGASTGIYVWNGEEVASGKGRSALLWCAERGYVEDARIAVLDSASRERPCPATDIVGAGPRLVEGGAVNVGYGENFGHARARHPRTAFATTSRGTMLLVTVDGRQTGSAGMTLEELAQELVRLGAVEAINLDGGGSTTMVAGGVVRNRPSDGQERAVSDALLLFSVSTLDDLARLLDRLAASPRHVAPGLHAQLRGAIANESMDSFRRLLAAAPAGQLSWQALRLLEEAAALIQ